MAKRNKAPKQEAPAPQPAWPAAVLLAAFAACVAYLAVFQMNDYDIWWHLRTGQWILQHHLVPHQDFYSYTIQGVHWVTFEWLSQVVFYLFYAAAGPGGLILFKAGLILATFAFIAAYCDSWKPVSAIAVCLALTAASWGARVSYVERPQIFTFFFTALYMLILKRGESRPRLLWSLPLLQVLWCNFHGGASTVGLVLIGGWWAGALVPLLWRISPLAPPVPASAGQKVSQAKTLGLVLVAAAALSLLNPNDWHIYTQMMVTVGAQARQVISEWEPLTFTAALSPIWVPLVLLEAVSAWAWLANPSRRWAEGLLWLAFLGLSFRAVRFTAQAIFFFAQLASGELSAVFAKRSWSPRAVAAGTGLALLFMGAGTWAFANYAYPGVYQPGLAATHDAVDAIAFLDKQGLQGHMFNSYELGGQLIWHGNGRPVFVDGRSVEYGDAFVKDAMTWFRPEVWKQLDARWDFQIAVIENGSYYLCTVLDDDPRWTLVYWDDQALVYVRNDGVNAAVARRLGYHYLKPNQTDFSYLEEDIHKSLLAFPMILSEIDRSIAAAPKNVNPHLLKAFLLRRANKADDALKECETAMGIAPDRPEPYYQAGLLLQTLGRLDEAEARYGEAMKRAFRFGDVGLQVQSIDNLGVIAYRRGDKAKAAELWHKALEKDPKDRAASHNLDYLNKAGGDMAKIEIQDVKKSFGASGVLKGVDVDIAEGEFFTLVGPSGCGKSTLLSLIAGLDSPTQGRLLFDGKDVTALSPRERDVAMVFQSYALYPHMRVRRNLAFPLEVRKLGKEDIARRVERVSKMLGLDALLERYPKELSGGQQQRVALGRALIRDPRVFLMDEPLSNLDAKLRTQMRLELKRLHREVPVTTVYVTHDQEEAMSLSDRLAILKDGVLQQCGTPQEVYDRPANLFVAQFIGKPQMNVFAGKVEEKGIRVGRSLLTMELDHLSRLKHADGGSVLVGVRPEHLASAEDSNFRARVDVVEMLGSESWLELDWDGVPLVLKTLERAAPAGGEVGLRFPSDKLHFFDAESKRRIL